MSQILVVANQTLGGEALLGAIQDRIAGGPCTFTLLVPATTRAHLSNTEKMGHLATGGAPPRPNSSATAAEEDGYTRAQRRLEYGLGQLRRIGAEVEGSVGEADVLVGIEQALARRAYDEIIVSTLPQGRSRWLRRGVADQARRRFGVPVTVITAVEGRG